MSGAVQRKRATYEDLLAVPDRLVAEIVDGELFASPRPALRHAHASTGIGADLGGQFHGAAGGGGRSGGWWILFEPELHFDEDIVVPDIAGWRRERVPFIPDAPWFDVSPDWLCEVVSPSTEALDRGRKLRVYARVGVGHLWLVNPIARTLEAYRLSQSSWVLLATHVGDEVVRAEPFTSLSLELSRWWLPEKPSS